MIREVGGPGGSGGGVVGGAGSSGSGGVRGGGALDWVVRARLTVRIRYRTHNESSVSKMYPYLIAKFFVEIPQLRSALQPHGSEMYQGHVPGSYPGRCNFLDDDCSV